MQQNEADSPPRLHTVFQFSEKFPAWTPAALRALIYAAEDRVASGGRVINGNGLRQSGALLKLGRRVLIHEGRFMDWLADQQQQRRGARPAA